jgi:hypothetical protein
VHTLPIVLRERAELLISQKTEEENLNEHIDPKRLLAASHVEFALETQEWEHIRKCGTCMHRWVGGFGRKDRGPAPTVQQEEVLV